MTFTQDDLSDLRKALLSGVTSISANGRTVNFQSLNEIKKLISEIEASIEAQDPDSTPVSNTITAKYSRYPLK